MLTSSTAWYSHVEPLRGYDTPRTNSRKYDPSTRAPPTDSREQSSRSSPELGDQHCAYLKFPSVLIRQWHGTRTGFTCTHTPCQNAARAAHTTTITMDMGYTAVQRRRTHLLPPTAAATASAVATPTRLLLLPWLDELATWDSAGSGGSNASSSLRPITSAENCAANRSAVVGSDAMSMGMPKAASTTTAHTRWSGVDTSDVGSGPPSSSDRVRLLLRTAPVKYAPRDMTSHAPR